VDRMTKSAHFLLVCQESCVVKPVECSLKEGIRWCEVVTNRFYIETKAIFIFW